MSTAPTINTLAPRRWPGVIVIIVLLLCWAIPFYGMIRLGGIEAELRRTDWLAIRFTFVQALLSAVISCIAGQLLARALVRRQFPGRGVLLTLMGAPFILPIIIVVLGLIALWGNHGIVAQSLARLGLEWPAIYGLHGVVLAHVFLNLPLALRLFYNGYSALPHSDLRLGLLLDLSFLARFRLYDWRVTSRIAPAACALIFVFCTTSFAVVLMLGGGPRATTVELAIYQAFRLEFDLARAAKLAFVQTGLGVIAFALALWASRHQAWQTATAAAVQDWPRAQGSVYLRSDRALILIGSLFLLLPLGLVLWSSLPGFAGLDDTIAVAALRSGFVALSVAALVTLGTLALLPFGLRGEVLTASLLALSPLVFGTGLFFVLRDWFGPNQLALPITILANALIALPIALRLTRPAWERAQNDHMRLARVIGLNRTRYQWHILRPEISAPLGFGLGLSAAFAAGDLGVIVLLGSTEMATLPFAIMHLMQTYRMEEAFAAAVALGALSLGLLAAFTQGGHWLARHQ